MPGTVTLVVLVLLLIFAATVVARTIRIVPQQTAVIIERLGSYSRTLDAVSYTHLDVYKRQHTRGTPILPGTSVGCWPEPRTSSRHTAWSRCGRGRPNSSAAATG